MRQQHDKSLRKMRKNNDDELQTLPAQEWRRPFSVHRMRTLFPTFSSVPHKFRRFLTSSDRSQKHLFVPMNFCLFPTTSVYSKQLSSVHRNFLPFPQLLCVPNNFRPFSSFFYLIFYSCDGFEYFQPKSTL